MHSVKLPTAAARKRLAIDPEAIYIEPEAAAGLLRACADEAAAAGFARATLCFADRLPGVKGFEYDEARSMLAQTGFALEEETWLPKPGLARHMGVARSGDHIGL